MKATEATAEDVREKVRERYGATATGESSCGDDCCTNTSSDALGYSKEDAALAEGADLGLGCGNPLAIASLNPARPFSISDQARASIVFSPRALWAKPGA